MLRSTRVACENVGDRYHHALCNLDLSEIYLELNLSVEAMDLARTACTEFQSQGLGYETAKAVAFEAIAVGQQGHSERSLKLFKQARAMFVAEKNQVWPSLIDLYQALVLFNVGRYSAANRLAKSALEFFDTSLLPNKAVLSRLLLARIAQVTGDLKKSRLECLAGLERLKDVQSPMLRHQTFLLMGQIESSCGNQEQAYSWLRASRRALETLRSNVRESELKLSFLKNRLEVYELLVDGCLRDSSEKSLREAFGYIEEAKSRILMDQMLHSVEEISKESGKGGLLRDIAGLRDELNWYYRLIELEQLRPQQRSREYLQQLEAQIKMREKDLIRSLRECSLVDGFLSPSEGSDNVVLEDPRQAVAEDTAVVEYFQSGDRILACVLTRNHLEILPLTSAAKIENVLELLKFQLTKFRLGPGYSEFFSTSLIKSIQSHLRDLYNELLAPVRSLLEAAHLLIVPHGALHYLPFHALFDGKHYVVDDHTVSYAPSLGVYALCAKKPINRSATTLLMGIPDERAPLIEKVIQTISSIWPSSKCYLGAQATERVLRDEGSSCKIVHIATHGYFRQD
ncbi:MAG TPA: CHAT domain-containing protein, partial [Terriglobales bacterium]|nr:CHAT domain-containing protein [Terriglobales bacterium]